MQYYGDRTRDVSPRDVLRRVLLALERARALPAAREDALQTALVEAGQLAQALADAAFRRRGGDADDPISASALDLVAAIARALQSSWSGDARAATRWPVADLERLAVSCLPASVRVSVPEGYAHYALYPQCHAAAAEALRTARRPIVVIGIRSIGTSLAAMVAAASRAETLVTVRPTGHPYHRRLALAGDLAARLGAAVAAGATFAVVDEGPGLSGSSFEAVASWLVEAGAPPSRLVFFPGHEGGLGPAAPERRRAWWDRTVRHVASFEAIILPRLRAAVRDALGAEIVADLGGGRWVDQLAPGTARPPVFAQQERRKYLARGDRSALVVRFAGVGPYGEETLSRAETLAASGLVPAPQLLRQGFLAIESASAPGSWAAAAPLPPEIARYVEFRARHFPAAPEDGAPPEVLLEMLRTNAEEALGPEAAARAARFTEGARRAAALPRVVVDGKMEAWEWSRSPDGGIWKLDATDHASGHDLVGCQAAAWDVAAAQVELGLPADAALELAGRVSPGATQEVLAFLEAAYLAHRLGRWSFAIELQREPHQRARIDAAVARYRHLLAARLGAGYRA